VGIGLWAMLSADMATNPLAIWSSRLSPSCTWFSVTVSSQHPSLIILNQTLPWIDRLGSFISGTLDS
jgi:hypothetical protein